MPGDLETVKTVATAVAPLTGAIIETWLKPKLAAFFKREKAEREAFEYAFSSKLGEYLERSVERYSYITSIVFQNQRKRLDDLYVPLTVTSKAMSVVVDGYKQDLIPAYGRVLLKDTAGMGKSTLLRFLFMSVVRQNSGVPVFVELRHLSKEKNIIDLIHKELNPIDEEFDRELILKLIRQGDFIFFLDGYDEIPFSDRTEVTRELRSFISKALNNRFILSSREDTALAAFSDFQSFSIKPLTVEQAFELMNKYDQGRGYAAQIEEKLKGDTLENIGEFLSNPLLVSLLYKSYEYKPTIPLRKHIFYRQVYDALFESHDLTKGDSFTREKASKLDVDSFHGVLRVLGFISMTRGKVEYNKDEILGLIGEAKKHSPGLSFGANDFLRDLCVNVPLFIEEGNYFRWSHKSIQDYFAAQYICIDTKGRQEEFLRTICKSPEINRYKNVLDICYDIDYRTFRNSVIYDLVCDFIRYYEGSYKRVDEGAADAGAVALRKGITFAVDCLIVPPTFFNNSAKRGGPSLRERVREYIEKRGLSKKFNAASVDTFGDGQVYQQEKSATPLIELLSRKGEAFAGTRYFGFTPGTIKEVFDGDSPLALDDDPQSPLNKGDTFSRVNGLIVGLTTLPILDYEGCKTAKDEIEEDIGRLRESDLLTSLI